ncbi:cupin [Pandoraea bronchicola]|uniref:Cupin n=1 Tax=Pandoraea bronchicola TaxID=2508287 RepID=A0A5E5BRB8_9BURK|nr:cupin [Pandoraea bronchicola]VVE87827.1 cupin [Pandoraea bronchicola]
MNVDDGERALGAHLPWVCEQGRDSLIGLYDDDSLAALAARGGARRMIGMFDAPDDASVHADVWECHEAGDELLIVARGALAVDYVDLAGVARTLEIVGPRLAVVPSRCWHRVRVLVPAVLAFVTPTGRTRRAAQPFG